MKAISRAVISCGAVYRAAQRFESVDEILKSEHSNEGYIEQYFPVVLFIVLHKVVLNFESVDKILKCEHSNESYTVNSEDLFPPPNARLALKPLELIQPAVGLFQPQLGQN